MTARLAGIAVVGVLALAAAHRSAPAAQQTVTRHGETPVDPAGAVAIERAAAFAALEVGDRRRSRSAADDRRFGEAAAIAWRFLDGRFHPATGLVAPVRNYAVATIWDVASTLAAVYCAHELGLVGDVEYESRVTRMLRTLAQMPLYDNAVFNRAYDTRRAAMMVHRAGTQQVIGWSAIDLGRLLIWLRIVGTDPRFRDLTRAIVARNDLTRAVKDGYLVGLDIDPFARPFTYQEGRIGYEQYAARGFALWDAPVDKALSLTENAVPVTVMGQELPADRRRWDRLTTEPFLLIGLELGWDPQSAAVLRRLVRAQEERFRRTGRLTLTGEDAIEQPPHYFYYYCVYANGKAFAVDAQDRASAPDRPRWISTKSAFALHALAPSRYSARVLDAVGGAHGPAGWSSGVYEDGGRSTGTPNVNTAAVVLSAALMHRRGEALLPAALRAAGR